MLVLKPREIATIRHSYKLSQKYFAILLGISVRTLQNWEIGHRVPSGPANALLDIAAKDPEVFLNKRRRKKDAKEIVEALLRQRYRPGKA